MKKIVLGIAVLLMIMVPQQTVGESTDIEMSSLNQIINITVSETWDMLTAEEGIQFVVDDRTFEEYFNGRIDTPHRNDKPILYPLQLLEQPFFLNLFITIFQNKDIIIYCRSANRSWIGANLLVDNGFQGVVYNMAGGINAWKAEGFPTVKGLGFGSINF